MIEAEQIIKEVAKDYAMAKGTIYTDLSRQIKATIRRLTEAFNDELKVVHGRIDNNTDYIEPKYGR